MDTPINWYFTLTFFSGLLGLIVAIVLLFANKASSFSARLLAGFIASLSLVVLNNGLMSTSILLQVPHFWRVTAVSGFFTAPLAYLYVRSVLQQEYRLRRSDYLLFIPAVLYFISMVPFYALPAQEKLEIISKIVADNNLIAQEPEGLLPLGWSAIARVIYVICTTIGQFVLLNHWKNKILNIKNPVKQNVTTYRWLLLFTVALALSFVLLLVEMLFHVSRYVNIWQIIILTVCATIVFISISLLTLPSILYGMTGWLQAGEEAIANGNNHTLPVESTGSKRNTLTLEQELAYKNALETHFLQNRPFRKVGYKIAELSKEVGIPFYQLSAFINQEYGKNFNELVNDYRVDYLAEYIKSSPEAFKFTLQALSKEAGFNSRNAFINAVKRKTGKTPSEYFGVSEETIA